MSDDDIVQISISVPREMRDRIDDLETYQSRSEFARDAFRRLLKGPDKPRPLSRLIGDNETEWPDDVETTSSDPDASYTFTILVYPNEGDSDE